MFASFTGSLGLWVESAAPVDKNEQFACFSTMSINHDDDDGGDDGGGGGGGGGGDGGGGGGGGSGGVGGGGGGGCFLVALVLRFLLLTKQAHA